MASKSMKPSQQPVRRDLTQEEKAQQIARFLSQKRETYITSITFGLTHNPGILDKDPAEVVAWATKAGDTLMETMFPMKEKPETGGE